MPPRKHLGLRFSMVPGHNGQFYFSGSCSNSVWVNFSTGVHYHYNISIDFDCDKALPFFLLICEQTKSLIGFGWGGPFDIPSNEWEKPHPSVFAVST